MKRLAPEKKGEIADKLLKGLPPPTEKELRAAARKTGTPLSTVKKLMGRYPRQTRKLKRAS